MCQLYPPVKGTVTGFALVRRHKTVRSLSLSLCVLLLFDLSAEASENRFVKCHRRPKRPPPFSFETCEFAEKIHMPRARPHQSNEQGTVRRSKPPLNDKSKDQDVCRGEIGSQQSATLKEQDSAKFVCLSICFSARGFGLCWPLEDVSSSWSAGGTDCHLLRSGRCSCKCQNIQLDLFFVVLCFLLGPATRLSFPPVFITFFNYVSFKFSLGLFFFILVGFLSLNIVTGMFCPSPFRLCALSPQSCSGRREGSSSEEIGKPENSGNGQGKL